LLALARQSGSPPVVWATAAADHLAAVALAQVADLQHPGSVFIAWDGDDAYIEAVAAATRRAAKAAGLRIAGAGAWNPRAGDFDGFARRIAASRAGAVVLAGAAPPAMRVLLRDLRTRLGPGTPLVASDGFANFESVVEGAGRAADGLYVVNAGLPAGRLTRDGRRLLRAIRYRGPDGYFIHAAQAAEILLGAIERSDGTRGSITGELLRTRIHDGLLGDVSFDRNGDVVKGPVTVLRIAGRRSVVDRVLNVSAPRE
jgi:branched-chain amino acid transport system substrate-binding protein